MVLIVPLVGLLTLTFAHAAGAAEQGLRRAAAAPRAGGPSSDAELARLRAEVLRTTQESRASLVALLAIYERDQKRQAEDVEVKRRLLEQEFISRVEFEQSQRSLAALEANIKQVRRWILEDDILITETLAQEEFAKLSRLPPGSYSVTDLLIRYNGTAPWSLADSGKIETFFLRTFGRPLPISAYGQSPAHDRLRFDHRDAMDVALHPDSAEGRSLMEYLRQLGVPFIAFRGRVDGAATGAHIHIGRPSARATRR
ncbi:MAG TPA: hypothetical protein VNL14_21325 [Candidatus Acidoferrales bacterium]|nr:hypothetical protein [Candidatus Acidoferrales bacterium]